MEGNMKKFKKLFLTGLMVVGLTSLAACGGSKKDDGASKKELQTLSANLESTIMNLDNLDYGKFSVEYKFDYENT